MGPSNPVISPEVLIALIAGVGGIVTTWLTVKYKDRVIKKTEKPKDRMETIFDGYEKLIVSQQEEIGRKSHVIKSLERVVDRLEDELHQTRKLLEDAREEVVQSQVQNNLLRKQLDGMKKDYKDEQDSIEQQKNDL